MGCIFDKFTNQFSLNKTLRFELKPVGKTGESIKRAGIITSKWENDENKVSGEDAERADNYKIMKRVLDEVHREFIDEALSDKNIKEKLNLLEDDITSFYKIWTRGRDGQQELQKKQKDLARKLKKVFDNVAEEWKKKYEDVLTKSAHKKAKGTKLLLSEAVFPIVKSLIDRSENGILIDNTQYSQEELKEKLQSFDKFHTYFEGFHTNRANIYDGIRKGRLISTSVAHRLFETNLLFHFGNIRRWEVVRKSVKSNEKTLEAKNWSFSAEIKRIEQCFKTKFEELFAPSSFLSYFSQAGIEKYNQVLGGLPVEEGKEKQKGLNEIINLARQQSGESRKSFPPMQNLYKQILSKDDKRFMDVFESDEEMLKAIREFYSRVHSDLVDDKRTLLMKLQYDVADHLDSLSGEDLCQHQLSREKIRGISKDICCEWDTLDQWWMRYVDEKQDNGMSKPQKERCYKQRTLSFAEIQAVFGYIQDQEPSLVEEEWKTQKPDTLVRDYIKKKLKEFTVEGYKARENQHVMGIEEAWRQLDKEGVLDLKELDKKRQNKNDKGFKQVASVKNFLDVCNQLSGFVRSLQVKEKDLSGREQNEDWQKILRGFIDEFYVMNLYNKCRNWITKKPYSLKKIKVNFRNQELLDGWAKSREPANTCVLFRKDGLFYLGIMKKGFGRIFDYDKNGTPQQRELYKKIFEDRASESYQKMIYKQVADAGKDIHTLIRINGEVKRHTKGLDDLRKKYAPSIQKIKNKGSYNKGSTFKREDLETYINYCKDCAEEYWKWCKFRFKDTSEYKDFKEFTNDIDRQGYSIEFENIPACYINEKVENEELYLFQIYNKDFSQEKTPGRKDNLHTLYWKSLFEEENIRNKVKVTKLCGGAEVFFRPASITYTSKQRQKGAHAGKLKGKFDYPILKDRRYSEDKYLFHVPVSLNNEGSGTDVSLEVQNLVKDNSKVNIIGIDRGEKHLLYYSVIDQSGKILEQGSLNKIAIDDYPVDYHAKLDDKEKVRDEARKSWSTIENIKELKAGYLSHVAHILAKLVIEHNAIVVLEDLNKGFKRGRYKIEKQVYQKFEKAFIDKLNYLVFKDREQRKAGHYLKAYQLTAPFVSFEKLGKQSGILFYTTAGYTSITDPVTGFLRNVYYKYGGVEDAKKFWRSFDSIKFNEEKSRFEFTYTIGKVISHQFSKEDKEDKVGKKRWVVCSCVTRSKYDKKEKRNETYCLHNKMVNILKEHGIDYQDGECFKEKIGGVGDAKAKFHKEFVYYFNAMLNIRVTDDEKKKDSNKHDYILSPVEPFFDSRESNGDLPENGDANGAYNIARKGICILQQINESNDGSLKKRLTLKPISKQIWQNYVQDGEVLDRQLKKL